MTSWRIFPSTNGPVTGTALTGPYIAGNMFLVTQGSKWLSGYWWWVAPTGQDSAPVGGFKFALWQLASASTGYLVPGSTVTVASLTPGQWNFVPLPAPLLLTPCASQSYGAVYLAAVGYTAAIGFPKTGAQFGAANPFSGGITNGPLTCPSSSGGTLAAGSAFAWTKPQMPFSIASSDPTIVMPASNDADDNLWLDVQITDQAPPNASYRADPNSIFVSPGVSGQTSAYTLGMHATFTQPVKLKAIWHFTPSGATILPSRCAIWDIAVPAVVPGSDNQAPVWSGTPGSNQYVSCTYANGPVLQAGREYVASTFTSDNVSVWFLTIPDYYGGTPGPFTSGYQQGPMNVLGNAAANPGQNSWNHSPVWGPPVTSTNPEKDGVDFEVTPVSLQAGYSLPILEMSLA